MLSVRHVVSPGPPLIDSISNSFSGRYRIPGEAEFNRVFKKSRRSADKFFTVLYRSNDMSYSRLGLAIAKRNIRLAVHRNRVKRIARESFRNADSLTSAGVDIVVIARPHAQRATNPDLFASLRHHWQRIASRSGLEQGTPTEHG